MAVTFVIGNAHQLSASLFAPGNSIASALANEFTEAVGDLYTSALIELGLILFVITTIVLALSKLLLMQLAKSEGRTHMSVATGGSRRLPAQRRRREHGHDGRVDARARLRPVLAPLDPRASCSTRAPPRCGPRSSPR